MLPDIVSAREYQGARGDRYVYSGVVKSGQVGKDGKTRHSSTAGESGVPRTGEGIENRAREKDDSRFIYAFTNHVQRKDDTGRTTGGIAPRLFVADSCLPFPATGHVWRWRVNMRHRPRS